MIASKPAPSTPASTHRQRRRGLGESEGLLPSRAQARPLARAQTRRTKQSRGWWEAQRKIDRLQRHTNGLRNAVQMTGTLVRKFKNLVIEDLNVRGMMQGPTPKAQADASMGEAKHHLRAVAPLEVSLAHRFYPSSKTCSNCGYVNAKLKRQRFWQCPSAPSSTNGTSTQPRALPAQSRDGKALPLVQPGVKPPGRPENSNAPARPAHR